MKDDFLILSFFLHLLHGLKPGLEINGQRQGLEQGKHPVRAGLTSAGLKPSQFCGSSLGKKYKIRSKSKHFYNK